MFTIGLGELLLIFVIAVVLIGPKQLPTVLASYQRIMQGFTKLKAAITRELNDEPAPTTITPPALPSEAKPHE